MSMSPKSFRKEQPSLLQKTPLYQWTWSHPRLWKRSFCPLLLFWSWCPSAVYHSLLSLKCIKKQEWAGKGAPAHTLLLSPDSTRGREISLTFSHLSWITLNPFNSLLPLVPGNNLRVSHSWPASPGSLGFYYPTLTKRHPNVSFQSIQHHEDAQLVTDLHHAAALQTLISLHWEHEWGMLACICTKAATEMHMRGRPRGTRIQAAQEGRQTR